MDTRITLGKRILSLLLTVIMVFSMVPLSVFAANGAAAEVTTAGGAPVNFINFADAVGYANRNGGTLKLLSDVEVPEFDNLDDIPFITGEFTLDLNGKSINYVDVGSYGYDEEADTEIKGTPGTLTVTDSVGGGEIEYLSVNTGALTVEGGSIVDLKAESYAAEVNITGGEVEFFNLNDGEDEEVSANVSGGAVQWFRINGGTLTVNSGEYPEKINMDLGGGMTNIAGGTFADLELRISHGEIRLAGGMFTKISTELEVGSSEYKEPTLASLLGDNCAFYGTDGGIVNADVLTLENVKIIADHKHSYGSGGKCTGCGAPCPHGNVVNATGLCNDCGTQLEAKVTYTGKAPVYYTSFREAIDSILHNQKAQVTVTLLNYKYDLGMNPLYLGNNNNIKLDLNGHTMSGSDRIIVEGNSALTVANGKLDSKLTIEAAGGDVTVEKDCEGVGTIKVTDAESTVTVLGGDIGKLSLPYTDTESLKNIKLSGGYFNSVSFPNAGSSDTVAITDMLEVGYAFKDNKGMLKTTPGGLVPYGLTVSAKTVLAELEVVKCEHGAVNEAKGYCNYCGKLYAAKITYKNGNVSYVEVLDWTLSLAENGTVKLLQDVEDRCTVTRSMTFDLNGRHVKILDLLANGTVTVKGSGSIDKLTLGYNYDGVVNDTTLIIEKPTVGTVDVGFLAVRNSTKTKLDGWSFGQIARYDGLMLSDLLADGYAIFDKNSGKPVYFSGNDTGAIADYYIDRHDHTFIANSDGRDECECGLVCDHTDINENGKCESCKTQIYFAVLTKADDTKQNYRSFTDAWAAAIENEDSTLKLLCDLDLESGNGSYVLKVSNGKFTLDLGRHTLEGTAQNTVIQVSDTADIKIINGKIENKFDGSVSSLSTTDANAVRVESGAAVTLDGVEFTAGSNENMSGSAVYVIDGKLTAAGGKFNGLVMLLKRTSDVSVKLASSELLYGIAYGYVGTKIEYETVSGFFADGNMLFDANGKYIDTADGSLWEWDDVGAYKAFTFSFADSCSVKPHTHDTYVDGKCAECDYACPHESGINDREASYFEKAICSVCHAEYGDYAEDTTAPTGEIKVKERTWWQSLLNVISFGVFFKEEVTVTITADDDSYTQSGYDAAKHAVKIEYFISIAPVSEEILKKCVFNKYTEPFAISDDNNYVIYAKLTDFAGNESYASTDGFVIDKTAPQIGGMKNYGVYYFCGEKTITVIETNIDTVTMDGKEVSLDDRQYTLPVDSVNHRIIVTDKAGNQTTVDVTVFPTHDFDKTFDTCSHCGTPAAAKVENGDISDRFATGDELFKALEDAKYNGATVTLLTDLTFTENVSGSGDAPVRNDLTIDLNGKTLQGPENGALVVFGGAVRIWSSNGEGTLATNLCVFGANASLTMDSGIGEVKRVMFRLGNLTIRSGRYGTLNIICDEENTADLVTLYGGSYNSIYFATDCPATAGQILGKGCRYDRVDYSAAQGEKSLSKVSVIPCDHSDLNDFVCVGCGMEIFLSVEVNGETTLFGTFEDAIRYAEANTGSTVKLLRDLLLDTATVGDLRENTYGYVEFTKGTYTLDLAGKTLTAGDWNNYYAAIKICDGCDLTFTDNVGGGKVVSEIDTVLDIRSGSHLTIEGGDYSSFGSVMAEGPDSLTLKGGRFKQVCSREARNSVSPLRYLADGYAFMLTDSGAYAGENDVNSQVISGRGTAYSIDKVTVVPAPVHIPAGIQPQEKTFYLTSPDAEKLMTVWLSCRDLNTDKKITLTLEKTDGTAIMSKECNTSGLLTEAFDLKDLAESSELYRVKIEFDGYVLYSGTFRITVAVCEHPGYDEDNKCTQCECDLAAAIVNGDKITGYVTFAEALAAAQTEENKGCTLKLLADVNGNVTVKSGKFTLDAANFAINGKLNAAKGADLTVSGGRVTGNVICAKGGKLTASNTKFAGTINCVGDGDFGNCSFADTVSAKAGSSMKLNFCEITGDLSVSGNVEAEDCIVSGAVAVNNGGSFKSTGGTYKNSILLKSGGTLEIISGTFENTLTAEEGSKLIVSGGSYAEVKAENNVDFTLSGGEFTNVTVNGQFLIDCLAEGKALKDMNNGDVIDGRVGIAGPVQVVDHTHTCVWKTSTHEKLCGCGYVEATDTEAPVISGIDPENNYYGALEFTVTDANDFTVWMDDEEITLVNGKYTMEPDNETHLITATDVAGNTVSFRFGIFKTYHITLPTGAGYTIFHSDGLTVRHGNSFSFIVQFNNGYSKTEDFKVLVNGNKLDELMSDADSASFVVRNVSEDLVITIEGVADITAPEVEVSIRGNSFKEFLNRITFGLFFKQTQSVEVKANDFGSGIKKVEYLLSETAFADKDAITGNWTELTLNSDRKAYFSIEPNQKTFIYVRVTDQSDNITVVNSDGVVVYTDSEAVTGAQTFTKNTDSDVVYKLNLNGNFVAKVYNGTKEIGVGSDYALLANGMLMLKNSYLRTLAAGEYTIRLTIKPMGEFYVDNSANDAPADVVLKLTVEKKAPTLSHKESDEKIYDGNPIGKPTFNTDSDGARTFEYKKLGEDDAAYTAEAPKNVGKYTIRITTAETDTFKAASSTMKFEIQPREVTISDVKVADKTYDGTTNATITNAGTLSVNYDGDNLTIATGSAAYDNKNVGTGKTVSFTGFELSGSAAGNYKLISQPASTTADITVKKITIIGATVESSKVYDGTAGATITNAGTLSDNYDGDNLTIVTGSAAYGNKNVGTSKTVAFTGFALAGDAAANYKLIAQPTDTTADITVKEITINGAAVEASRIYNGMTDAKITNAGTPSVNYDGENLKVAAGKAAYDNKNVGKGKAVTFTGFALEGDAAANYKLTAQPEAVTADITVKEIKIVDTAVEASKVYDGSTDAKITEKGTFDGLIDGDKVDIVTGKAAYDDKNVGNGKTVAFYEFALSGDDAANYVLSAQPASTTASISAKELTISDLKVKDKQYDGKNTAEIDGTPTLVGVVDGDVLTLVNGVPTFDSVKIGKNIPVSLTAFTLSGDRVTVANYTLTQPSGIMANIVEYVADGSEYGVNSNDWLNKDFVIAAKDGYKLSLTDTANGEWVDSLTASDETGNGKLTFYVKNTETGVISAAVTENYKIDKTAPTGEVKLNERTAFQKFINTITFGLFFKDDVNVKLTAKDEASDVKSVLYFKSDRILTDEEVRAITDWTDNSDFDIEAKDMDKFVIYVRIEDNAGNVTLIGSDGATFDTTAPEIVGAENGKTYYVTKKVAIDDENLESVTLSDEPAEDVFTLAGDTEATYIIRAVDKAGNVTEYTVYMKPISSVTDAIAAITDENVKSSDADVISAVERQILDIAEAFDDGESTEDEWKKLTEAAAKCKDLNKRIAEVADEITRLTDAVNGYDIDKVTSADKADIEKQIADIDTLLNGDNLTDAEKVALEALKGIARALLDRIAAAKDAAEADEIKAVDGITKDNVKLEDKETLEKAEKALEGALRDFDGNYTEEENNDLEKKLETVKAALAAIGNAEKAADEIGKLPLADDAKLSDKSELDQVKKLLDGLTENEKTMLGKDALGKVDALAEKIQKLAEEANSPKTGDTSNPALWVVLLFISGGIVTGTTVVSKKKKRSVK